MRRVAQPPVNPAQRDTERHEFWPGFIATLAGLVLVFFGAGHVTGFETAQGPPASELQLMKAYSSGGLQYADKLPPPAPPPLDDPMTSPEALERWAKQTAHAEPPSWKVRIDLGAKTPCPT
jgi:hypothetical protein